MASSCGIHIDQRRFHLVALDGSPKKHKVSATLSGEIAPGEDPVTTVSAAIRKVAKKHKLRGENVSLAVDSGLAAFRNLTLPFDDRSKIEDVIKFEVENDLPQWDIDEVIVDFLVLSTKPGVESNLLVTAIPKIRLERQLSACERAGLEASDAELDGTALFNAAYHAGLVAEGAAQILVHVGDTSTTVVVADEGKLTSMRAIRAGALPPLPSLFETADEGEEGEVGEESAEHAAEHAAEDAAAVQARLEQTTQRIRRELGRTIAGIQSDTPIEAIYVCGHELLTEESLFDVPVLALEALPETGDGASDSELTVAYGAALGALGGSVVKPHLRREELRFTGKFERLELPLAVFSLLLFTLLAVQYIVIDKQITWRDEGTLNLEVPYPGDMQMWLETSNGYLLPNANSGYSGRIKNPPKDLLEFIQRCERGEIDTLTKFQEIQRIRFLLSEEIEDLQRELGQVSDIKQPQSALRGMTLVMGVVSSLTGEERMGLRSLSADYRQGRSGSSDVVEVKLDMDFFAEDSLAATRHYKSMQNAIEAEDWCVDFSERPTNPLDDGSGISVDGIIIKVNVEAALATEGEKS